VIALHRVVCKLSVDIYHIEYLRTMVQCSLKTVFLTFRLTLLVYAKRCWSWRWAP